MVDDKINLKERSDTIFEVIKNTAFNYVPLGVIKGLGLDEKDIKNKPFIGVVNTWNELNPGHKHLRTLTEAVKYGIIEAGGYPFEFCTVAPCDGWANGNEGMRHILPQRDVIADSIELMMEAHRLDAMVTLSSCDKINPACLMAAVRLDIPTICVPGGPGYYEIHYDANYVGTDQELYEGYLKKSNCVACGSLGACEIMGTANTFQCLMEAFGMTLPNAANAPSFSTMKQVIAKASGKQVMELLKKGITPSQIMTEKSLENVLIVNEAIGGSTNATLHLPAIAYEMGIDLDLEEFNKHSKTTPTIANIYPSGRYGASDLYKAGGIPAVLSRLKDKLNLDCQTVLDKPLKSYIRRVKVHDDDIIRPLDNPVFPEGGTVVLKGNLAPDGSVIKQSAVKDKDMLVFEGPAVCFESEADSIRALSQKKVEDGSVLVIRYEGPKGAPGMPELLAVTAILMMLKYLTKVALITDGRFSGGTSGPCIGHVSPEAYVGGPIAIVENGDNIKIDIPNRKLNIDLTDEEIKGRFKDWKPIEREVTSKALLKYRALVTSAAHGAILKF